METKNAINIAVLTTRLDNHLEADKDAWIEQVNINKELIDGQKAILKEMQVFTTTLKAGRWVFGGILLALGAFGHKGLQWAVSLFYGN